MERIYIALSYWNKVISLFLLAGWAYAQPCFKLNTELGKFLVCKQVSEDEILCSIRGGSGFRVQTLKLSEGKFREVSLAEAQEIPGYKKRFITRYSYCAPDVEKDQKTILLFDYPTRRLHGFSILDIKKSLEIYQNKKYYILSKTGRWVQDSLYIIFGKNKKETVLLLWNVRDSAMQKIQILPLPFYEKDNDKIRTTLLDNRFVILIQGDNRIFFYDVLKRKLMKKNLEVNSGKFQGELFVLGKKLGFLFRKGKKYFLVITNRQNFEKISQTRTTRHKIIGYKDGKLIVRMENELCLE